MSAAANALHALAAVIWVGGMFFAYMVLRPAVGGIEPPPQRLQLWSRVFPRFFAWVWAAVIALPVSGYYRLFADFGGMSGAGLHIHAMQALAMIMILLFFYLFNGPYLGFRKAVAAEDWAAAGGQLNTIRRIVATNLVIGLVTTGIGASGRLWP